MKKNYFSFLFATLMLFVAMPAKAQVSSFADLCGKYQFSADMEVTDDGQSYADKFKNNCEVTIVEEDYPGFIGAIGGFAGLSGNIFINSIDVDANTITIATPNQMMGAEALYLNDLDGSKKIFGDDQYGNLVYTYNPETKVFTLPDFSLATKFFDNDNKDNPDNNKVDKIVAKFTNVTLTLIAAEDNEPGEGEGEGNEPGTGEGEDNDNNETTFDWVGTYTVKANNVQIYNQDYNFPSEFDVEIEYDELNDMYLITKFLGMEVAELNYGGILVTPSEENPNIVEIQAGGVLQAIVLGESYLYLMNSNANNQWGIQLTRNEDNTFDMEGFTITDGTNCLAYYTEVTAVKEGDDNTGEGEEEETFDWVGTYTVKANNVQIYNQDYNFPSEFDVEIEYDELNDMYLITKFLGMEVAELNYGGILVTPSEENPNIVEIQAGGVLQAIVLGESYLYLMNSNANNQWGIQLTRNEDSTFDMEGFTITDGTNCLAYYTEVTAVKKGDDNTGENEGEGNEPGTGEGEGEGEGNEPGTGEGEDDNDDNEATSSWDGTYTVTIGEIEEENDAYTYPSTFEMVITSTDYGFFITKFFGQNVGSPLNYYGGIQVKPLTDNPDQAEIIIEGTIIQEIGEYEFLSMRNTNLSKTPLLLTRNADGTYTIEDFEICSEVYTANYASSTETLAAKYKNITVTKKATSTAIESTIIENKAIVGIFDLLGRKLDAITGPGLYIVNGKKVVIK